MSHRVCGLQILILGALIGLGGSAVATTIGGAMGNGSADARPIVWKNRDGGRPTGSKRHFVSLVKGRTYPYLGIHPSDRDPRMGVNEMGVSFGNATAKPFNRSDSYDYANTQAFKQFVLGETANLAEIRRAIHENILGGGTDWPDSIALMPGISDASGRAVLWELGDAEYYEYGLESPDRLAQSPWQIYARDNDVHARGDHTDDWSKTNERYVIPRTQLIENAAAGGSSIADMIRIARLGEPHFDDTNVPSRPQTSTAMIAHGVLEGEDPRVVTMWTALGQPDYATFVPIWLAVGDQLSPRVSTNDLDTSLSGASQKLVAKREADGYDTYSNRLLEPMEVNFLEAVEAARTRWLRSGVRPDEALRIHLEASETAWQTMNAMSVGQGRSLNVTPEISSLSAAVDGLTVTFGAAAIDPDGEIVLHDWDLGDGMGSPDMAPVHTYAAEGTYLVRYRVTDDGGSRNSRWLYVTLGPDSAPPVVTVTASDPVASEPAEEGAFRVIRTGPTLTALVVSFGLSGSAVEGSDYAPPGASITIPAGASSATVPLSPLDDAAEEGVETATLTLSAGSGYVVAAPANATVSIADDEATAVAPAVIRGASAKGQ